MVGVVCPPPVSPRCHGRAGAQSSPASPLVSQTPPGIPPPGTAVCFPLGNSFCMSWSPQSSGGPRGDAVVRPSRVESSSDSTGIQPLFPPHTPCTPLSLSVTPEISSPPPLFVACTPPRSGCRTPPDRVGRPPCYYEILV